MLIDRLIAPTPCRGALLKLTHLIEIVGGRRRARPSCRSRPPSLCFVSPRNFVPFGAYQDCDNASSDSSRASSPRAPVSRPHDAAPPLLDKFVGIFLCPFQLFEQLRIELALGKLVD